MASLIVNALRSQLDRNERTFNMLGTVDNSHTIMPDQMAM